ncbi:hypothetical protein BV22DRAFT_1128962 [Leucogyrophana mollusca]|uniref:Uncharacterized protein n=1 Tax=Leucogyrophana mollusca TaxID=85980 RepID=A0ACB8BJJ0_9AGAM|nr:hypothetical protein BV22DRAFT_1128962 [Leucogyrophana mollusca]
MVAGVELIYCYDLDSEQESDRWAQRVYCTPPETKIADFECVAVTTDAGQFAFAVCVECSGDHAAGAVKIFRIVIREDTPVILDLVLEIAHEVPELFDVQISPCALVIKGGSADQDVYSKIWAMDIRTYQVYKLSPPVTSEPRPDRIEVCLGATHIFVLSSPRDVVIGGFPRHQSYVEAFPWPVEHGTPTLGILLPSHRSEWPLNVCWWGCQAWNTLTSASGESHTTLTAMAYRPGFSFNMHWTLVRLALAPHSTSSEPNRLGSVTFDVREIRGIPPVHSYGDLNFQSLASDGANRRVLAARLANGERREHRKLALRGLTVFVDDTETPLQVEIVGESGAGSPLELVTGLAFDDGVKCFDEARGRFCVREKAGDGGIIRVMDLA